MAYFSLHAYDADVWVRQFKGLNQADESLNPLPEYAAMAENVETPNGVLQPQAALNILPYEFEDRVETFATFYRRWYKGSGDHTWYVVCVDGKFYQKQKGTRDINNWQPIPLPTGITAFQSSAWSWVTYEITPEEATDTIDVLLLSNAKDGMIMIIPPDMPTTWGDLLTGEKTWNDLKEYTWAGVMQIAQEEGASDRWEIVTVDTGGKKFGVIERYAERIWGADIDGNPDMLMYSRPYDPTDWTAAGVNEQPEDGAGDILQPSWDGDKFYALKAFGDQLLAFKRNRVWRVLGTNPGEYNMREQFGGGTCYPQTVAIDTERLYVVETEGLSVYDGLAVHPFGREMTEVLWRNVNRAAMDQMCAAMFQRKYYLAYPEGDSTVNNAVLVYNLDEGTFLYYKDMKIESLLPTNDTLFATSSSLPGKLMEIPYDSWLYGEAREEKVKWISPWMDFGYKRIQKGGFDLYFTPEVQNTAVTIKFTIETEKKAKSKSYTIQPTDKEHRNKRLHFGGTGRRFRLIIETEAQTAPWRLIGGLQMIVETDPD